MDELQKKISSFIHNRYKSVVIMISATISWSLTVLIIYGTEQYGMTLFILIPIFMGMCSSILYGLKKSVTWREIWIIGAYTLAVYAVGLLIFAIEGILCLAMVAPIGILGVGFGSLLGFIIVNSFPKKSHMTIFVMLGIMPLTAFVEKDTAPILSSVITSVEIEADLETVWENVIEFPELDKPSEFLFQTGIAYPINAKIEGKAGVGAIRYCNFTTGSFVEPITVWNKPNLLAFDVLEQPVPMKELSFWDIDAPHLHDYFVSKRGQFKLTKLSNGNTLLEGTTWYYHKIAPTFYWKIWSDYIIHEIHNRVLKHIKKNAEK